MAYLNSNEPYHRVDNTQSSRLANTGAMIGAGVGAGLAGGSQYGLGRASQHFAERGMPSTPKNVSAAGSNLPSTQVNPNFTMENSSVNNDTQRARTAHGLKQKGFGSGWRKAATYGGSAVAGALIGG